MKVLLFSGSLRKESLNKKLLIVVEKILSQTLGCETMVADLQALYIPVYDGDVELVGIPEGVTTLGQQIHEANAIIVCSPEYNGSIAGSLKNTIDWVSRLKPMPLGKKPILLTGASPGALGSVRALGTTRTPFETLGSYVYPQAFGLPKAHEAFSPDGDLTDQATKKRLLELLTAYKEFAGRF